MPEEFELEGFDFKGHALDEVISFWLEHSIDEEFGGFWTHLERDGNRFGDGRKFLVMQSRMIYSFTLAYRLSGEDEYLEVAENGANFLMQHFWDEKHGGWFWSVERSGRKTRELGREIGLEKRSYGHAFAIYGLSEFARISGNSQAQEMALETYELTFRRMWDKSQGGLYHEMDEDWYLRNPTKRLDTHLHMLEALCSLAALTQDSWFKGEIVKICDLICDKMQNERFDCMREWFLPDWRENLQDTKGLANYGHNLETSWFLRVIGESLQIDRYIALAGKLLDFSLREGWDERNAGFFDRGKPGGEVIGRDKIWWVQCEGIGSLSFAYRITGEEIYRERLEELTRFCYLNLFDDRYGEWFHALDEKGNVKDDRKGGEWKAAYHVMQACYHAHENLNRIGEPVGDYRSGLL